MAVPIYYDADMVRGLPDDGNRYEVVHGELLVTPSPGVTHQLVISRLLQRIGAYLVAYPEWVVLTSPADISWASDVLVQPDVFVVPARELKAKQWGGVRTLPLVIEVLSPSTRRHDRFAKRRAYQEHAVPVYWIVDSDSGAVEVWTPEATAPTIEREFLSWHPAFAREALVTPLRELFEDA